jgi:hypothetical protein
MPPRRQEERGSMRAWTSEELELIGTATEVDIAPLRANGSPREYTTIWVVRVGDDLYVRSYRGADGHWYRHAVDRRRARVRVDGIEHDVAFDVADSVDRAAVDAAYRDKYGRSSYVDAMVAPDAAATTLRIVPRE